MRRNQILKISEKKKKLFESTYRSINRSCTNCSNELKSRTRNCKNALQQTHRIAAMVSFLIFCCFFFLLCVVQKKSLSTRSQRFVFISQFDCGSAIRFDDDGLWWRRDSGQVLFRTSQHTIVRSLALALSRSSSCETHTLGHTHSLTHTLATENGDNDGKCRMCVNSSFFTFCGTHKLRVNFVKLNLNNTHLRW